MLATFWRLHSGRLIGVGLFVASLLLYTSHENQPVLGRWSWEFAALIAAAGALWVALLYGTWRRRKGGRAEADGGTGADAGVGIVVRLFDAGVLVWGAAYALAALADPVDAGRAADLNFFGSTVPAAATGEWVALALFVAAAGAAIARARRLRGSLQNFALMAVSLAGFAVLGEGAARLKALAWPSTQGFPTYSSRIWNERYGGVNGLGFRDVDHAIRAEPGVRRLLVVGDSYTYGTGIERPEDRFGARLVGGLARETSLEWEVLNAGERDTHTLDHLDFLDRMLVFRPDVVVLLYVFNDIDYLDRRPRSGLSEAPTSVWSRLRPSRVLFLNSYLFQEIYIRWRLVRLRFQRAEERGPEEAEDGSGAATALGLYGDEELLTRHLADLARFVEAARAAGAGVRIVPFDIGTARGGTLKRRYSTFVSEARRSGLPLCNLEGVFDGLEFDELTVNVLDGHPNERAHALAAEAAIDCVAGR